MALLAQQELLEVPPARRLIVPRGHGAWWGIDPGVKRVAAACAENGPAGPVYTPALASFADLEGGARLSLIREETARFAARLIEDGWAAPGIVFVEQPSGRQPNPPLSYATGVIIAAFYDALREATGVPVRIETCASSWWKRKATGYGAYTKPTRKTLGRAPVFEDYAVARWARTLGYDGSSWDCCDAIGIAEAARREVALEER